MKIICILSLLVLLACNSKIEHETYLKLKESGNDISNKAQSALLANVGMAMQKGGPEYAVEFCNLQASAIVDSLNREYNCTISRISERNRNPKAALSSALERKLWSVFQEGTHRDTLVRDNNKLVFYKPIKIAMPACLKCHGSTNSGINMATHQKLQELYPDDLATGYALNDFRGLWKIEFEGE